MEIILPTSYDMYLMELIGKLDSFPKKEGKEGCAYFVNDKFVVKEYYCKKRYEAFDKFFELFAEEQQKFNEIGLSMPKVYSFLRAPTNNQNGNEFKFFLLEERVNGRNLFLRYIDELYSKFEKSMSQKDFYEILQDSKQNLDVYSDIIRAYIEDFIIQNATIDALNDEEIEAFIDSVYYICKFSNFSFPDVHSGNVLMNESEVSLIDNYLTNERERKVISGMQLETMFAMQLVSLFYQNFAYSSPRSIEMFENLQQYRELTEMVRENAVLCDRALVKIVNAAKNSFKKAKTIDEKRFIDVFIRRMGYYAETDRVKQLGNKVD